MIPSLALEVINVEITFLLHHSNIIRAFRKNMVCFALAVL